MSEETTRLAFTTRCLPGSAAEKQEQERIAEFLRNKAIRQSEELRNQPALAAQREAAYQAAFEANQERKWRATSTRYGTREKLP